MYLFEYGREKAQKHLSLNLELLFWVLERGLQPRHLILLRVQHNPDQSFTFFKYI